MAIHEYKCENCGNIIEIRHNINNEPSIIFCNRCDHNILIGKDATKIMSLNNFKLNWQHFHNSVK